MQRNGLITLLLVSHVYLFEQHGFVHVLQRAETVRFNHKYVNGFKVVSFKYNRTSIAINTTTSTKVDFGKTLQIEIQAYRFASNEYRLFPIRFAFNLCDSIARNDFGLNEIFTCGNFTGCPMNRGTYFVCNWAPNSSKYPPYIPEGDYMLDIKYFNGSTELVFIRGYGTIQNVNKWHLR